MSNRNSEVMIAFKNRNKTLDFYQTPVYAIESLLKREKFKGSILDPCCGKGRISESLKKYNYKVKSFDINSKMLGYGFSKDFFTHKYKYDNIIMNPPYNICENFILHGLNIFKNKMAVLLRLNFLESIKRYNLFFRNNKPSIIYVFSKRLDMRSDSIKTFGGGISFAWFIWHKNKPNRDISLKFICD
ncbi:MAG TPA: NAD(P)-dependent oxidoreductase [Candidatus Pacearchaeota archaeon]|nr:NAD(P)-dependent oxidoreductase [Candidatus Pacearchaeota archaeon]